MSRQLRSVSDAMVRFSHAQRRLHHKPDQPRIPTGTFGGMNLADRVAQCHTPLNVESPSGKVTHLSGAAECAPLVTACPIRYVLTDDLTRLCTELAYSKGARNLECADLLRVPATNMWIEWCFEPYLSSLEHLGFPVARLDGMRGGRRGALIRASLEGRRGTIRTLWSGAAEGEVLASSIEAYFDFDTEDGDEPTPPDCQRAAPIQVSDAARKGTDVLGRCFRFRYESTWSRYYGGAGLSQAEALAVQKHVLGTIALDIPVLLTFLLLLASRASLPHRLQRYDRLNRSRLRRGRIPLLEHVEVHAPLLPEYLPYGRSAQTGSFRRGPRLHHVRGHLVRRGSTLYWRVPHIRGSARFGAVRTRTVTWNFDNSALRRTQRSSALS